MTDEISLELKKLALQKQLEELKEVFALQEWDIELIFSKNRVAHGSIELHQEFKRASIIINEEDDTKESLGTLNHEFWHLMQELQFKPVIRTYRFVIDTLLETTYNQATESLCRKFESAMGNR